MVLIPVQAMADGKQGANWFGDIDRGEHILWVEDDGADVADIRIVPGHDGKTNAFEFVFKKAGRIAMTNRKNPTVLKPESRERRFILRYWLKTETDYRTGNSTGCSIRMQTPAFIGAGVSYPRSKFMFLDDWKLVGDVFTLKKDGLIGSIQFRPYSTEPGLRIWIDDPFFTEVTDMSDEEVRDLLGDADLHRESEIPFRKEYIDQSAPEKGNKAWNTGFEAVADGMWGMRAHRMQTDDFTTNNTHSGCMAIVLKNDTLGHPAVPVANYKKHSFSVYARRFNPDEDGSVSISMNSWRGSYCYSQKADLSDATWQRVSVTEILMPVPSERYYLEIRGRNAVIDDVQFEEGDVSSYSPRKGIESALVMDARAYIYDWGDSPVIHVVLANPGENECGDNALLRVWDIFGKEVYSETISYALAPDERLEKDIGLPDTLRGEFCADLSVDDTVLAERVFSVLPTPRDIPAEESMLGDHLNFTEFNLWSASRLGTRWTRCHDGFCKIFKMYRVNPSPEKWCWNQSLGPSAGPDDAVALARKHGIKILGLLDEPPGWVVGRPDMGRTRNYYPEDWEGWLTYVRTIVDRYRNDIDSWELYNEPSNLEKYLELCQKTYPVFKDVLPQGRLVGLSSTPITDLFSDFHDRGGHRFVDGIATHIYAWSPNGNLGANFREVSEMYRRDGEPMPHWMTEGNFGGTAGMMFRSHPGYNEKRTDVASVTRYLTVAHANNVDKVFYYWSNYPSPNPQTTVHGNRWSFYHSDTSITAAGAAWSVWAKMLDGTEPLATIVDTDEEVYLFKDGDELVAVAWAETERDVELPGDSFEGDVACRCFDVMGNPDDLDLSVITSIHLDQFPLYFRFLGARPQDVVAYFRRGLDLPSTEKIRKQGVLIKEEDAFPSTTE